MINANARWGVCCTWVATVQCSSEHIGCLAQNMVDLPTARVELLAYRCHNSVPHIAAVRCTVIMPENAMAYNSYWAGAWETRAWGVWAACMWPHLDSSYALCFI